MSPTSKADPDLNALIAEITIDCHDEDEALQAFQDAFDEDANLPLPGSVIGERVEVLSVGQSNGRRELTAMCEHAGHRYEIALLDITIHADPPTSRLIAAYRHWVGA